VYSGASKHLYYGMSSWTGVGAAGSVVKPPATAATQWGNAPLCKNAQRLKAAVHLHTRPNQERRARESAIVEECDSRRASRVRSMVV
jgi:hypothetical protein